MSKRLNEEIANELLRVKEDGNIYHRESQNLEFKESFNFAGLADYFRDFSAFANNKGGYLIFGVKDKPKRELIGLAAGAIDQFDKLDPEKISGFLLDIFSNNISWEHEVFTVSDMTFGIFYIYEANVKPIICKKDEGKDQTLKNGEIYFRYGGRTQRIQYAELEAIINKRIDQNNSQWMDLVQKIGRSGPQNAAVLDTEQGLIEKGQSQILVVDEELLKGLQMIKEGEFSEKEGAKTLKLVGNVSPIEKVEVVKKVQENKLKEYPLSATELVAEIKKVLPEIKQNRIYDIIRENGIKDNRDYCDYVFRNNKQQEDYDENKTVPTGTPCIYKSAAVDFVVNIHRNEIT